MVLTPSSSHSTMDLSFPFASKSEIVRRYAEHPRVIGQALEARDFAVREIVHLSEWYVIHGIPEPTDSLRSKVRHWLRRLQHNVPAQSSFTLDLTEIEKLAEAGRARRSTPGRHTNLASVSNSLRTIGAYLDAREVELLELKKGGASVTLWYRDNGGHDRKEQRNISSFSQLCVKLLERRHDTQAPSKA
jgi:hypothetical protein